MTIKVNLLPTERKKNVFDWTLVLCFVVVLLAAVCFVLYGARLQNEIEKQKAEITDKEKEIREIEANLPIIEDLKSQIAKLEDEIRVIESLVYDPVRYGNLLGEVGRVLPSNIYLNSLTVEPSTTSVMINGVAKNTGSAQPLASIAGLMSRMSNSSIFQEASLASTQQTGSEEEGFGFSFQIEVRYNPDAAAGLTDSSKAADTKTSDEAANS